MAIPDFEAWAMFATVAEHGSFGKAARALGVSTPTVSKAVARLERGVGTMLFNRTSRRIALTDTGTSLVERAAKLLSDAIEVEECAREEVGAPRGTVRLAVPMSFGLAEMGLLTAGFLTANPEITIEMHLSDAQVDLVGEGYDLALRIAALPDSSLRARKLREVKRHFVASPGWIAQHGRPATPDDLNPDAVFGYMNAPSNAVVTLHHTDGREQSIRPAGRLRSNNGDAMLAAVEAGVGVAFLPDFIVEPRLQLGTLVILLEEWRPNPIALYLVTPPGKLRPRRVTAMIAWLTEALQMA